MIRLAFASVADTAIIPLQDILGLDSRARMNMPGKAEGNWGWRFRKGQIDRAGARPAGRADGRLQPVEWGDPRGPGPAIEEPQGTGAGRRPETHPTVNAQTAP